MNKNQDFVDKIIFSYFEDKNVPENIEKTINQTKLTREKNILNKQLKKIAMVLIIPVLMGSICVIDMIKNNCNNTGFINQGNNTIANENLEKTTHEYPVPLTSDYIVEPTPKNLYEISDLVIIGKYINENKVYVNDYRQIITNSKFNVIKTLKGDYSPSEIDIEYNGGIVPLREFMDKQDSEQNEKFGFSKLTDEEINNKTFEMQGLKVYHNTEYVIFLGYNEYGDSYMVISDGYGMRELSKDGKIYNLDTKIFDVNVTDIANTN